MSQLDSDCEGRIGVDDVMSPRHGFVLCGICAGLTIALLVQGFWNGRPVSEGAPPGTTHRVAIGVDPNAASWAELALLPGIGPVIAKRIVSYRESHSTADGSELVYRSAADLTKVRGVGEVQSRRIAGYLRFPNR